MHEPSTASDPPRADVVAAAVAASAWIRRRRAAWSSEVLPPLRVAVTVPEHRPGPAPAEVVSHEAPSTPRGAAAAAAAARAAGRLSELIVEWWRPLAATVAIAAVGAAAVIGLPAGWRYVTVTLGTGTAVFESVPDGSGVSVDGIVVGQTPITRKLPIGHHVVEFRTRKATRVVDLNVSPRGENVARVDWTAKPTGHLHVESSPDGAHVLVDGSDRGVTPLTLDVVVGSHVVVLRNASGSVQRTVAITPDKTTDVSEGIYAGFLQISSSIELTVSEGSHVYAQDERNQTLLPAGPHVLQLRNRDLGFSETRRIEITPGETFNVDVNPVSSLSVTSSAPARVAIDGTDAGETPLTNYPVSLGTRDIVVKASTGVERRVSVKVTTAPARLDVDFSKP